MEDRAYDLVKPFIEEKGYDLWDVCFEKEGAMWYLRILFDKEGGIDSDECEEISRPLNELIDKQDFIDKIDMLEIGTPGLSKKLRKPEHFVSCTGEKIRATVRDEKGKEVSIFGILSSYDGEKNEIVLDCDGETKTLSISECVKINSDL
ncbi:MAG: ribosome maturation factor RimP [Ruminiclostridium sp.]|nr:ribosome maturation factor RimP [Ruminiclostridium sp.]MBQ8410447.1 ribosome maturation factor RimP [Ruminiclostridium sp.]MBQ8842202.1 ribosome maturation factor RimP [Ruminiclostridium sp.]